MLTQVVFSIYVIFDLFLAMASSTALNCFNNSSRRVVFDEDGLAAAAPADGLLSGMTTGARFFEASTEEWKKK